MLRSAQSGNCVNAEGPGIRRCDPGTLVLACCAALAVSASLFHARAQSAPVPTSAPPQKLVAHAPAIGSSEQSISSGNAGENNARQQVADECADLLKLANDLKAEVDKSTKDTLSLSVVRKADQIEQLAHRLRTGQPAR